MNEKVFGMDDYDFGQNVDVEQIEVEDPTLFSLTIDSSYSMDDYVKEVPLCIDTLKDSIIESKSEDEFVVSVNYFDDKVKLGGYQKIHDVSSAYNLGGCTALYSAIVEAQEALKNEVGTGYYDQLRKNGITPKGIFVVLSDGYNNVGAHSANDAKKAVKYLNKNEIITAYIAFGSDAVGIGEDLGFANVINVKDANKQELRKIFRILSKSAISASRSANAVSAGNFFQV